MATTKITSPELFDLASLDTALKLPSGTTAERPTSPSTGEWRYNTDNNLIEFWDGANWIELQDEAIPPIASENFNTVLYTGNGSTQSLTGVGFQPDLVWIKDRDDTYDHYLFDSIRGATKKLAPNKTLAEATFANSLTSFDTDGFSVGNVGNVNNNGDDFVAWCWKAGGTATDITSSSTGVSAALQSANSAAGFSIVSYTTNASDVIIPHGLNSIPKVALVKRTDSTSNWFFYNTVVSGSGRGILNSTDAFTNSGVPTFDSTNLTFQTNDPFNSGSSAVVYFFADVDGFSKFGTYTGNGSSTGPIITTGFELAFLIVKNTSTGSTLWLMADNKRDTNAIKTNYLQAQSSDAEYSPYTWVEFLSNGFQLKNTGASLNANGANYIYMAFATDP